MPKTFEQIAEEIRSALPPLKDGYYVKPADDGSDNVLVGNADLAFAITRNEIDDNLHFIRAKEAFPALLASIAQYHAVIAAETDIQMTRSIVETYART